MARKKKDQGSSDTGSWLNTYADMVTLLLTFFILLFSMSSLDSAKFNLLVTAFASDGESSAQIVIRGETTTPDQQAQSKIMDEDDIESLADIMEYLQEMLEQQSVSESVSVQMVDGVVFIQFMDDMLFEPNSATLKSSDRELLGFVGQAIKSVQDEANSINIVGHTAEVVGDPNYPVSDRLLSTERANAVLMYFEDEIGIDGKKLFSTGLGKWQPIADNETPEGMSKNRRVEIMISSESNSLSEQLDNVYEKLVE